MKTRSFAKVTRSLYGTMCTAELICILSMFIAFSLVKTNVAGLILFGAAACLLYYGMLYGALRFEGDEDRNRVRFGHMQKDLWRGVKVGFLLMIPYAVAVLVSLYEKLFGSFGFLAVYKLLNAHLWPFLNLMTRTGKSTPMYLMETGQISWSVLLPFWSTALLLPLIGGIAYLLGYKDISVKQNLIYRKNKEE